MPSDQNKWWKRWFPPTFPKASYFVNQFCGSFLHAWIEPWGLFLSSNVSGLLSVQNRWKPKYLPYPCWQTWHLRRLSPLRSLYSFKWVFGWALDLRPCSGVFCRLTRMGNGPSQELNSHWLGWQTQKRPQELTPTLQAAPWVKQCLDTAVFWQHGCVSGGESCLQILLWTLRANAEALQRLLGFLPGISAWQVGMTCTPSAHPVPPAPQARCEPVPSHGSLAGIPGVGRDGWGKVLWFLRIKRNPSHAQGWMEWAGSSVQLGLGSGLRSKPGCSHPYIHTDLTPQLLVADIPNKKLLFPCFTLQDVSWSVASR